MWIEILNPIPKQPLKVSPHSLLIITLVTRASCFKPHSEKPYVNSALVRVRGKLLTMAFSACAGAASFFLPPVSFKLGVQDYKDHGNVGNEACIV